MSLTSGPSGGGRKVEIQAMQLRPSSRADVFSKFLAVQKTLKARSFAVFKLTAGGAPGKRKLVCEMDNTDSAATATPADVARAYGDNLLSHIEMSMLPLTWYAEDGVNIVDTADMRPFVVHLKPRLLPISGIAFPVRLGAIGNGYVMFISNSGLDLSGEAILEAHGRSCKLMMDMLALDERRAIPAETLSDREIACLQLAGDGRISDEIAGKLSLSVHTVNAYLGSATIKLDSVNRIQAIAKAIRLGYIN